MITAAKRTDVNASGRSPDTRPPVPRRRLRNTLLAIAALFAAATSLYGWALLSLDSSLIARALVWRQSDADDWRRFPARPVEASPEPVVFGPGTPPPGALTTVRVGGEEVDLDSFLADTGTTAFLVLQDDRLIAERYYNGSSREDTRTSFSVAKSFVSTLIGIAIAEGAIGGLDDPITAYIPELAERDPRLEDITLRHLVSMSSGLRYVERDLPWSDDARTYYAPDLREAALSARVAEAPGATWLYNNYNPLLAGIVLERATGMPVAEYLETRLWQPMGAEAAGSWSLDSEASGFEKMESGINGRAIDFLKLGWLFLHEGRNGDAQVVPAAWVAEATRVDTATDPARHYQYFWWLDEDRGAFYAAGNHGQFIYVVPEHDLVVVRMGDRYGHDDWVGVFGRIVEQLEGNHD